MKPWVVVIGIVLACIVCPTLIGLLLGIGLFKLLLWLVVSLVGE